MSLRMLVGCEAIHFILCLQKGSTPLQAAIKNGHQDVVEELQYRAASQKTEQVESFFS